MGTWEHGEQGTQEMKSFYFGEQRKIRFISGEQGNRFPQEYLMHALITKGAAVNILCERNYKSFTWQTLQRR